MFISPRMSMCWYDRIVVVCLIIRIHWHSGPQRVLAERVGGVLPWCLLSIPLVLCILIAVVKLSVYGVHCMIRASNSQAHNMQYQIVCCPPSSGYILTAALCVLKRLFSDTLSKTWQACVFVTFVVGDICEMFASTRLLKLWFRRCFAMTSVSC